MRDPFTDVSFDNLSIKCPFCTKTTLLRLHQGKREKKLYPLSKHLPTDILGEARNLIKSSIRCTNCNSFFKIKETERSFISMPEDI